MRSWRRVLRLTAIVVGAILAVVIIGLAVLIRMEWTYLRRLYSHPDNLITQVSWYEPREVVAGGDAPALPRLAPEDKGMNSAALETAAKLADAKNASALLVARTDAVVFERYWRGLTSSGQTNSASMAKTITALLIGIARDEGLIKSLDEPAATWLPAWRDDARKKITLRHLLQMHAGLQPMGEYSDPLSDAAYLALGTDLHYVVDGVPAVEEPGIRFDYNNINFQALGHVLEAATGMRYSQWLSKKLWQPIGARDAGLWLDREGGGARTFGYIFAVPEDFLRIGLLLLYDGQWNGHRVISHEFLLDMKRPSKGEPRYGLGIWLAHNPSQSAAEEETFLDEGMFYLDGHSKQRVYIAPAFGVVVVRVGENGRGWDEAALPNAVIRSVIGPEPATH